MRINNYELKLVFSSKKITALFYQTDKVLKLYGVCQQLIPLSNEKVTEDVLYLFNIFSC